MNAWDTTMNALNAVAFTVLGQPTTWVEVIGFVTGGLCVWLVARQNILNWPLGILNNLTFLALFTSAGLFADAGLQIVYVALAVWGWWNWVNGGTARTALPVTRSSGREWAWLLAATVAATAVMYGVLTTWTSSTVPLADASTTAISLAATYGQIRKRVGSWWLWILADLIYVPLYAYKGLWLTAVLYVVFLALCVNGLRSWSKELTR